MFTLVLEDVFKRLTLEDKSKKINKTYLSHLRFADDIVLQHINPKCNKIQLLKPYQNIRKREHNSLEQPLGSYLLFEQTPVCPCPRAKKRAMIDIIVRK